MDKVTLDQTAIPWVLLSTTTTPGPDGDRLVDTTFIQRINTAGGLTPPAADCNAATAGTVVEVPVHGRLRLLEAHRCLTRPPVPESRPDAQPATTGGTPRPQYFVFYPPGTGDYGCT